MIYVSIVFPGAVCGQDSAHDSEEFSERSQSYKSDRGQDDDAASNSVATLSGGAGFHKYILFSPTSISQMNARHLDNVISIGRVPALLPRVSRTSRTRLLHASAAESTSDIDEPSHTKREYKILGFYPYVLYNTCC